MSICDTSKYWTFPMKQPFTMRRSVRALKVREAMIGANDLFIAAHARSLQLTLVTNNTDEFGRVQDLNVENWTSSKPGGSTLCGRTRPL
jgi:hypothetical protein